jgi:hypothetical protein
MRTHALLITTLLSTTMLLGVGGCSHKPDTLTSGKVRTDTYSNDNTSGTDHTARDAAEDFIGHINYARVALARNKGDRAEKHIVEARADMDQMKALTIEQRKIANIESGRVVYSYDTDYKYHYFPIETGAIEVKKMGHGPIWAKNDLAVTDAEVVYLTVNLSGYTGDTRLDNAEADIKAGKLKAADVELAKLTDEVVTVDDVTPEPLDMARDNIVLTTNFIATGNYTGARYALKHADTALHEMQKDDTYSEHQADIVAMRRDIKYLQNDISKKNPTMMQKAGAKLSKWWSQLKSWNSNGDNQKAGNQGYGVIPHIE